MSFGGGGPLHACAPAESLRISRVLVPRFPGALSAYGILISDAVRDYSRSVMLKPGDRSIAGHFSELLAKARNETKRDGLKAVAQKLVDMRYAGQATSLQ